jgi:hypothetical protein
MMRRSPRLNAGFERYSKPPPSTPTPTILTRTLCRGGSISTTRELSMRPLRRGTAVKCVASLSLEAEAQANGRFAQQQAFDRALRRESEGVLELVNAATNAALNNFNAYNQSYWNTENLQQQTELAQYNAADQNYWNQYNASAQNQYNRLFNLTSGGRVPRPNSTPPA